MKRKSLTIFVLAATSLLALASCQPKEENNSSSSSESSSQASSEASSTSGSAKPVTTLKRDSLRAGMTFVDGAVPHTTYVNPSRGDDRDYGNGGTFVLTDKSDESKTYEGDEPLPAGTYIVNGSFNAGGGRIVKNSFEITVTEGNIDQDKGVDKTVSADSMKDYKFMNYPGMDIQGSANTPSGCMPSTGESRVLVIPVEFKNTSFGTIHRDQTKTGDERYDKSEAEEGREIARKMLNEAFFAENDKTQEPGEDGKIADTTPWESLHSYYEKASFGKLNITGAVSPVYQYNRGDGSSTDFDGTKYSSSFAGSLATEAVKYFVDNKVIIDGKVFDPKDYDSDGDGYIDGVEMVYVTDNPTPSGTDDTSNDIWWNYTTSTGASASKSSPNPRRIFFSRWDYLINTYYTGAEYDAYGTRYDSKAVDAHTIVHETGHMMGAADYYSYDKKEGPAGCVDMMDNNVGDHNAYTKMAYGWLTPWVVDYTSDDFEITLPSYTDTGNFLIVPASGQKWNGTPWDEYLLIEYYTPTGVNEDDSDGYEEWQQSGSNGSSTYGHGGTYRRPGVQMFHVDTRASSRKGETSSTAVRDYTDTPKAYDTTDSNGFESSATRVHTNTPTSTGRASTDGKTGELTPFRELHAVYPSTQNSLDSSSYYSTFGYMSNLFGSQEYFEKDGEKYGDQPDTKYGADFFSPSRNQNFFPNKTNFDNGKPFGWSIQITSQTDDSVTLHFVNNLAE